MALKAGWMCLEKGAPHRAGRVRALGLVLELGAAAVLAVQTHNQGCRYWRPYLRRAVDTDAAWVRCSSSHA